MLSFHAGLQIFLAIDPGDLNWEPSKKTSLMAELPKTDLDMILQVLNELY
ncbi:hypothetical protein OAM01_00590 [bacterium]|nr:hypothetical protein [bacterium]